MKNRAYFMTVIDGVFCLGDACYKQTGGAFQSSTVTLDCSAMWAFTLHTVLYRLHYRADL